MESKAKKSIIKIILGIICLIISLGALFMTAMGIIVYFINVPEALIHNENCYYKGKVLEVEIEGSDGNISLDEIYFKVQDENGIIHNALVYNEQNLKVLERTNFAFEYEGKQLDCVFTNYGEGYEEEKYIVALTTADKEFLNYKVGKGHLVNQLTNDDKTNTIIAIVFGIAFLIFFTLAILGFRGKPCRHKTQKEQKTIRGSRLAKFVAGYLVFWGVCAGLLVGLFVLIGGFQVNVDMIAKPELCYDSSITKIEETDNDEATNYYQIFVESGVEVQFTSDKNAKIALDNDFIKDFHNGQSITCIYTYVEENEASDIIALYSETKTYLDKDTGITNLKDAYRAQNASAKTTLIIFGVLSPIAFIIGIVILVVSKQSTRRQGVSVDKRATKGYKTRIGLYIIGVLAIAIGIICFFVTLWFGLLGTKDVQISILKDDNKYDEYEIIKVEEDFYNDKTNYTIYVYNEEYQQEELIHFYSDKNEQIARDNGFFEEYESKKVNCIYNPYIFGDGETGKIASLYTDEKVYLDYEIGKANLIAGFEDSLKHTNIAIGVSGGLGLALMVVGIVVIVIAAKKDRKSYEEYIINKVSYLNT